MNDELKTRLLSFAWRFGAYLAVAALAFLQQNITDLQLSPMWVAFIGLLAGELTKYLNSKYQIGRAVLAAVNPKQLTKKK